MKNEVLMNIPVVDPEPFPIADFTEGLNLAKEPWLSPRNAFRKMENVRSFRGQLVKRTGYTRFASISEDEVDQTSAALQSVVAEIEQWNALLPTEYFVPETLSISGPHGAASATITITVDMGSWRWTPNTATGGSWQVDLVDGSSTVVATWNWYVDPTQASGYYMAGAADWSLHADYVAHGGASTLTYRSIEDKDITGLVRFRNNDGVFTIALNEDRVYLYDGSDNIFKPQGKAASYNAYFTGANTDYWWTWPGDDYLLMTNGVDPVHYWDPSSSVASSVAEIATAWGGGGNELDTCRIVIRFRGRTLYFRTTESSTVYPTRVRWTDAGSYTSIDSLAFADAPTNLGDIVTAGVVGNRIFVGFEEGWMELVATGDAIQPFSWEPLVSRFGAVSKLSTIEDNERLLSRSETTMQAIDPNGQYYADAMIPDLVRDFRPDLTSLSVGFRNEPQRSFWWTYVTGNDTQPGDVLVAAYDEANNITWSQYTNLPFDVFSEYESLSTPTWDSLGPLTWDDFSNVSWDEARVGVQGFTETIGGGRGGHVYTFGISNTDNLFTTGRSNIDMCCETQSLAPYPGQKAFLAWMDVYADAVSGASIDILFYTDSSSASYKTITVDLSGTSGSKVWRRISVGKVGSFHRFRVDANGNSAIQIDAFVPYFRPAGRVRTFN